MKTYRLALIDLDGTLIDQSAIIHRCCAETLAEFDLSAPSLAAVRRAVGSSPEIWLRQFAPAELVPCLASSYRRKLATRATEGVRLLPGCREFLRAWQERGVTLALLTNKDGDIARRILRHARLDRFFNLVVGADDTPWRKPQPQLTLWILDQLRAESNCTCVVGDSPVDLQTAQAAGLDCMAVASGAHSLLELHAIGATRVFLTLWDLAAA